MAANFSAPYFSVVILTKNEQGNIKDCIKSLHSQKFKDFEIIVVDDYSSDKTIEIVKGFENIRVFQFRGGFGKARNFGIEQARGSIIVFISADAYADSHWLENMARCFGEQNPDAIYGKQIYAPVKENHLSKIKKVYYDYDYEPSLDHPLEISNEGLLKYVSNVNAGYKKEVFQLCTFDEELISAEDLDLAYKLIDEKKMVYDPTVVVYHKDETTFKGAARKNFIDSTARGFLQRKNKKVNKIEVILSLSLMISLVLPIMSPTLLVITLGCLTIPPYFMALKSYLKRKKHITTMVITLLKISPIVLLYAISRIGYFYGLIKRS